MSYILNALRKSEQERQASQAETITDQVLAVQPEPKSRKPAMLIGGLLAVNLIAVAAVSWYLLKDDDASAKPTAGARPAAHPQAAQAPDTPAPKPLDRAAAFDPAGTEMPATSAPVPASEPFQTAEMGPAPAAPVPSIEEMAYARAAAEKAKEREADRAQPALPIQKPNTDVRKEQLRNELESRRARRAALAAEMAKRNAAGDSGDGEADGGEVRAERPAEPAAQAPAVPLFKDLPYDFRSSAPKVTINVFAYDTNPEKSFVVLNMTKYRAGQITKDAIQIEEIRPDGLIASYGGRTFRIEKP